MSDLNYILEIMKNEAAFEKLKYGNLSLENELINASFIYKWNNHKLDIDSLSKEETETINFLYNVTKILIYYKNELEKWNLNFEYFYKTAKQDIQTLNREYEKQNSQNIKNHEMKMKSIEEKNMLYEIIDDNKNKKKAYHCISVEKSDDMIEFEEKHNYILNNIFSSIYLQFVELCSISYSMTSSIESSNVFLIQKFNSLKKFNEWKNTEKQEIIFKEINSLAIFDKSKGKIFFSLTKEKLEDFCNLSKTIYSVIFNILSLEGFINKVQDIYYKIQKNTKIMRDSL